MANYHAADVKALREKTGAGMMDVKKALEEADGDFDKALEILRVKGLKGVGKREGRTASDGLVAAHVEDGVGTLVEINCETDFVAKSDEFHRARRPGPRARPSSHGAATPTRCWPPRSTARRVRRRRRRDRRHPSARSRRAPPGPRGRRARRGLPAPEQQGPAAAGRRARGDRRGDGAASPADIAMHIAALRAARTSPATRSRPTSSRTSAASPRRRPARRASPRRRCPKIVEGRVNGFFKENVLLEQAFAKDNKKTVAAGPRRGRRHASRGFVALRGVGA